jgi:Rhs element Vgr protein
MALKYYRLQHVAVTEEEAQNWANAQWLKSQMSKVNGRVKCEGIGTVNPGDIVKLSGVGERYNGNVLVTGVRHDFDTVQGWKTHIQFGSVEKWLAEEPAVSAPKSAALLPGVNGLQIGVVVSNEDPDGEHRVRVRMPLVNNEEEGAWARVAALDAGKERGFFFRPEIGDEVVLGFLNDDPRQAVILGMLHSSAKPAPLPGSGDNHEKGYQSRSKMKIYFNDEKKVMQFETPAGNKLTLSEADKSILIEDQNSNKIEMTADGIKIESSKAIELKSGTEIKLESGTVFNIKAGTELKLEGTSGAEISSTAIMKVKGSLVQIN